MKKKLKKNIFFNSYELLELKINLLKNKINLPS
jgi:hypothetical protein